MHGCGVEELSDAEYYRLQKSIHRVYQTDFTPSRGNALQACFATILHRELDNVPNFITDPEGYLAAGAAPPGYPAHSSRAVQRYLAPLNLCLLKVPLNEHGKMAFGLGVAGMAAPCVVAGGSPRGDHKHCVVARLCGDEFMFIHDPHPDGSMLSDNWAGSWAGFLVATEPHL